MKEKITEFIDWIILSSFTALTICIIATFPKPLSFLLLCISTGLAGLTIKKINNRPPCVGVVTLLGERIKRIKKEGYRLCLPPLYNLIEVKRTVENFDFVYKNIRTKELGEIKAVIGITVQVDYEKPERVINFLDRKEIEGVKNILQDIIGDVLRREGKRLTWIDFTFSSERLLEKIIEAITGKKIIAEPGMTIHFEENGFPDEKNLGIKILRVNIKEISEQGALKEAAGLKAKEEQERKGENYELDTEIDQAKIMQKATGMSSSQALSEIRSKKAIREGRGIVIDIKGIEEITGGVKEIAKILNALNSKK